MISIMKYFKGPPGETEAVLRRTVSLLLQLIELHAIEGDSVDYAQFRSSIHSISGRLSDETPDDEILIIVGEIATSLKEYAARTTRFLKAQTSEYQRIVKMLTETIAATTHASDHTVERLRDVERKLESASVIEDVRVLRMRIDECLVKIRDEIQDQHMKTANSAVLLHGISSATFELPAAQPAETDPVTGLPGRVAAESALQNTFLETGPYWAAVVVADRIASINSRFGHAVGDRVLRKISEQLRNGLSAEDRVFRWSGPAFMPILRRTTSESRIRSELARITSGTLEEVVEIANRSILLPISSNWALFPMDAPARVICEKADKFVATQTARPSYC